MGAPSDGLARLVQESKDHQCGEDDPSCVKIVAAAKLPSRFGDYRVVAFENCADHRDHAAFVHGDILGQEDVPLRIHSECLTGDAIGSLRCDCRDQLIEALRWIGHKERGLVLYLRQEGRGIGFANKIRAYELQDSGYDTVEANERLGFHPDERDYAIAAHMLDSMHVRSVRVLTNNPDKIEDLKRHGIEVTGRVPLIIPPNAHDKPYLLTKQKRMGHLLDLEQEEEDAGEPAEGAVVGHRGSSE